MRGVRMARTRHPAALPERTPEGASSMTTQLAGGTPRAGGSGEIGFGIRLTTLDVTGGDEMAEKSRRPAARRRTSARGRVAEVTTANWLAGMEARSSRAPGRAVTSATSSISACSSQEFSW